MKITDESVVVACGVQWDTDADMFAVVGEQYYSKAVARMRHFIESNARFTAHAVFLVEEDSNPHDSMAVAVMFPFSETRTLLGKLAYDAETVGHLPRDDARKFRKCLRDLGISGHPVKVPGCVVSASDMKFDNVSIYLPKNFSTLVKKGQADDERNKPLWLVDETPIPIKPHRHTMDGSSYTLDEQRRLYCRYAQMRAWSSLPHLIEDKLAAYQQGIGVMRFAISYHHLGFDENTEEGKQKIRDLYLATAESECEKAYRIFDEASVDDLGECLERLLNTPSNDAESAPEFWEMELLRKLKKADGVKYRGLATAWMKIQAEANERLLSPSNRTRFLSFGQNAILVMLQVLLSDSISAALEKAGKKQTPAAKDKVIDSEVQKVLRQCADFPIEAAQAEVQRFYDFLQSKKLCQQ